MRYAYLLNVCYCVFLISCCDKQHVISVLEMFKSILFKPFYFYFGEFTEGIKLKPKQLQYAALDLRLC